MIEIYAIYKFCKLIGKRLRARGYNPFGYQVLLVVFWFLFEMAGAVAGLFLTVLLGLGNGEAISPLAYLFALLGAASGAAIVIVIVNSRPNRNENTATRAFPVETELQGQQKT